jgi:hypothetical protein
MEYEPLGANPDSKPSVPWTTGEFKSGYRQSLRSLVYVDLDNVKSGIVRDVAESGITVQLVRTLAPGQQVHLSFELPAPRTRVEAMGRVGWADSMGQAGIEFIDFSRRSSRLIKDWIFTQLLSGAYQSSRLDSMFPGPAQRTASGGTRSASAGALNSAGSRLGGGGALREEAKDEQRAAPLLYLSGRRFPVSLAAFSRLVDGLVLLSAMLLFAVVALAITHIFPGWPTALALALAVFGLFAAAYWCIFTTWGNTPGTHLAQLVSSFAEERVEGYEKKPMEAERARFR